MLLDAEGDQQQPNPNGSLRFRHEEIKDIYFKDWLCNEFKSSRHVLPENIRKGRNFAITLAFIEVICCVG